MKKRLLSLVLCLIMVFSLLPFAGFAAEPVTQPDGTVITNPDAVVDGTGNLHLSKTLAQNQDDGTYSINLESFATADVSTVTTTEKIPTDFIVIVDQSGSMATTDMVANTSSYQSAGTVNLETAANGGYYYYDSTTGQYYQVYGRRGYLNYLYARKNTAYADDLNGGSLFYWFTNETTTASGAHGVYYWDAANQMFCPVTLNVKGVPLNYQCYYYYTNKDGELVLLPGPDHDYHDFRIVQAGSWYTRLLRPVRLCDYIQFDAYRRVVAPVMLCYRDINGVEHVLQTTSGKTTTEFGSVDRNGNLYATQTLNGTSRMQYNGLYTANASGAKVKRLDALSVALNQFAQAVAEETDTFGAVDNRIAIVGFSSQNTSNGTYNNTELLTGSTISSSSNGYSFKEGEYYFPYKGANYAPATSGSYGGTNYNGPQYYSAPGTTRVNNTHYAAALISANNGTAGTVNPDVTKGIKSITAYGGTKPEDGFDMALKVYQNRSNTKYTIRSGDQAGQEVERNKIVIFFTDGQPGMYPYSDQYAGANAVVQKAYDLKHYKNPGSNTEVPAAIFSIGVFSEADSNPLTYEDSNADSDSVYDFDYAKTYTNSGTSHYLFRYWLANDSSRYGDTPNDTIYDYMSVVSSNYPNATTFMDNNWKHSSTESWKDMTARVRGNSIGQNSYYRMASNQDTLVAAFEAAVTMINTNTSEQETVTLDSTAILRDTVNTTALDVSGATYTARRVPIKYDNGNFTEDENRTATVIQGYENVPVPANGQISVDGFNYKDDRTSATKPEGWKLVVTISGLVPKQMGTQVDSNVGNAGIYGPSTEKPAVSIASPKLRTAGLAKTYVIDFNAPMTVAENTTKLGATAGTNGTFDFKQSTVTYKLKSDETMVGGANIALSGVDTAMVYGVPANSPDGTTVAWNKITAVPASSVYFDDDLTTALPVGDGHGYADIKASSPEDTVDTGRYTITFNGTGIDVYCTTTADGGYVQGILDGGGAGKVQTIKNQVKDENSVRYNVPTISFRGLSADEQHTLVLNVLNGANYRLDGVRVYKAIDESEYTGDIANEANASYTNLRTLLVNDKSTEFTYAEGSPTGGLLYVDDASKVTMTQPVTNEDGTPKMENGKQVTERVFATDYEGYKANSPKNEIYLAQGQGIAFTVTGYNGLNGTAKDNIYVGLSTPKNETATVKFRNVDNPTDSEKVTISSGVDMYYKITPANVDGDTATFVIINTSDVVVSVTNFKISGNNAPVNVVAGGGAVVMSVAENDEQAAAEPVTLRMLVNRQTLNVLANLQDETAGTDIPDEPDTPDVPDTPDTPDTPDQPDDPTPTQTPTIHNIIQQIFSSFVNSLFKSISRLFR